MDPLPLSARSKDCFAYPTLADRSPVMLTQALDTVHREWKGYIREIDSSSVKISLPEAEEEAKFVIGQISKLKYELQTNKSLAPLGAQIALDYDHWKLDLEQALQRSSDKDLKWFDSPWLLVECYMYKKLNDFMMQTKYFQKFDPFRTQKRRTLVENIVPIRTIAEHLVSDDASSDSLLTWLEFSLWGNRCDLSLKSSTPKFNDVIGELKALKSYILIDDSDKILSCINHLKSGSSDKIVDIVLDNAGFELFTDLCLAHYLTLKFPNIKQIRFHIKCFPWFVSDTTQQDLDFLLNQLKLDENEKLKALANIWSSNFSSERWSVLEHPFWTYANPCSEMKVISPDLYDTLSSSHFIIFKGDLNYRKLLGDLDWPHDTDFKTAIRGFAPSCFCTLRTCKADLIAGLKKSPESLPKNWMVSGEYAVMQAVIL